METDSKRGGLFSIYSKSAYFELKYLLKLKINKRVGLNKGAENGLFGKINRRGATSIYERL